MKVWNCTSYTVLVRYVCTVHCIHIPFHSRPTSTPFAILLIGLKWGSVLEGVAVHFNKIQLDFPQIWCRFSKEPLTHLCFLQHFPLLAVYCILQFSCNSEINQWKKWIFEIVMIFFRTFKITNHAIQIYYPNINCKYHQPYQFLPISTGSPLKMFILYYCTLVASPRSPPKVMMGVRQAK